MSVMLQDWMRQDLIVHPIYVPFNDFRPHDYQLDMFRGLRSPDYRHACIVAHRDFGKDFVVFEHVMFEMYEHPANYHYIFQTLSNAKEVIWHGITYEGIPILDYIPPELVIEINKSELFIKLRTKCGRHSTLKFLGSVNYNAKRGPKVRGVVYSEAAYCHPKIFEIYKPMIRNRKDSWEIHISTPAGDNHFKETFEMAKNNKEWFVGFYPINVTKKLTEDDMEMERQRGTSEEMIQQEYYCSFERGVDGSYYAKYLHQARLEGRVGDYRWDSSKPVYTAWDLGSANTRIIFFQVYERYPYVIDSYHEKEGGLELKVKLVLAKPYIYGGHFMPHDGNKKEDVKGITIKKLVEDLGLRNVHVGVKSSPLKRIENTRVNFSNVRINQECRKLLSDLNDYHQKYDSKNCIYTGEPAKDGPDHYADAFGEMFLALPKINKKIFDYSVIQKAHNEYNYSRNRGFQNVI